jgi:hypothetical protein
VSLKEKLTSQYLEIINLVKQAFEIARKMGIKNLLQPGLVKEMIIAEILGHLLVTSKRDVDACNPNNPEEKYEYLSCAEGGSGQLDRMFSRPREKREESLYRIRRNKLIYFAIFNKANQIEVLRIYEIEPNKLIEETIRQLDISSNAISHVGFSEAWAKNNGKLIHP